MIMEERQIVGIFKKYFKCFLNLLITEYDLNQIQTTIQQKLTYIPKYEDVQDIIKKLKNNKDTRENRIVAEVIKIGGTVLTSIIKEVINIIWETEIIPEEQKTIILCTIFKKRNTSKQRTTEESHYWTHSTKL